MKFLVQIRSSLPYDLDEQLRADVLSTEGARGAELRDAGMIVSIWRIPGTTDNVGIWECADADDLHDAIRSLPAYPWMSVTVTALATHPLMPHGG